MPSSLYRRFQGGVAATDHGDGHVAVEGSVAGRAVDDAATGELLLTGDVQMTFLGTAGDDDGPGLDLLARSELQHLGPALNVDADDLLTDETLQPVQVGLLEEQAHQVRPVNQRHAGVVGHRIGDAHLATQVVGDQDGAEVLAGGIHGRRESGRPAADHRYVPHFGEVDVALYAQGLVELAGGVHVGDGVVAADPLTVDEDLRYASLPRGKDHLAGKVLVVGHIALFVVDVLAREQRLDLGAVGAPFHGVDHYARHGPAASFSGLRGAASAG